MLEPKWLLKGYKLAGKGYKLALSLRGDMLSIPASSLCRRPRKRAVPYSGVRRPSPGSGSVPAGDRAAGIAGIPRPMALPRLVPPPDMHASQGRALMVKKPNISGRQA